jgi:hypothetical protein
MQFGRWVTAFRKNVYFSDLNIWTAGLVPMYKLHSSLSQKTEIVKLHILFCVK